MAKEKIIRFLSLLFTALVICLAVAFILCEVFNYGQPRNSSSSKLIGRIQFSLWIGIFYLANLIVSCFSETPRFLRNKLDTSSVYNFVHKLQLQAPLIEMHVSCYHYTTRVVTTRDSQGRTSTRTETSRVVTHQESRVFNYLSWEDVSQIFLLSVDELQARTKKYMLRLYLKKNWIFTDPATLSNYEEAKMKIQLENRFRDQYMDYSETMKLDGFKDYIMTQVDPHRSPWFFGLKYYMLSVLLLMTVPYCWYVDSMSYQQDFLIEKRVSVLPKVTIHDNFAPRSFYEAAPDTQQNPNAQTPLYQQQAPSVGYQQEYQASMYQYQQQPYQNGYTKL